MSQRPTVLWDWQWTVSVAILVCSAGICARHSARQASQQLALLRAITNYPANWRLSWFTRRIYLPLHVRLASCQSAVSPFMPVATTVPDEIVMVDNSVRCAIQRVQIRVTEILRDIIPATDDDELRAIYDRRTVINHTLLWWGQLQVSVLGKLPQLVLDANEWLNEAFKWNLRLNSAYDKATEIRNGCTHVVNDENQRTLYCVLIGYDAAHCLSVYWVPDCGDPAHSLIFVRATTNAVNVPRYRVCLEYVTTPGSPPCLAMRLLGWPREPFSDSAHAWGYEPLGTAMCPLRASDDTFAQMVKYVRVSQANTVLASVPVPVLR